MKKTLMTFSFMIWLISCNKQQGTIEPYSEATYRITITGKWQSPEFTVPAFVHFTTFAGMVHNSNTDLWHAGKLASPGVEAVAEVGNTVAIYAEIDSIISTQNAISRISIEPPTATGAMTGTVVCNSNFPLVSFISMLAPSPDWFTGMNSFNLYDGKRWVTDMVVNIHAYDAGTEDGDAFSYNNPSSTPQQNIRLLNPQTASVLANGNVALAPIATVRFTRL